MTNGPLMVDVAGLRLTDDDRRILQSPIIAGVILFSKNIDTPEQIIALTKEIRDINPNFLITVDQEGGRVQRLKNGFTRLPAMRIFGEIYDENPLKARDLCETCAWLMASEVLSVGIDFSFAPVLDLDLGISDVIGDRAFHQDPNIASELATIFTHGMYQAGMIAVGKHFPGHGGVSPDSHIELPVDSRSLDELSDELATFKHLIAHDLPAIMPAHIHFTQIDQHMVTYSQKWLQDILRQQLNFNGIIISDDLCMAAANDAPANEKIDKALAAGCDLVLYCHDQQAVLQLIENPPAHWQQDRPQLRRLRAQKQLAYNTLLENPNWQNAHQKITALIQQG